MMDRRGRDQFVVRYGDETEVHWNDAQRAQAEEVYKRSFWTESFVVWSPHGSYLATVHRQGVAIWGGPSFSRLHRFSHPNVRAPLLGRGMLSIFSLRCLEPAYLPVAALVHTITLHITGVVCWVGGMQPNLLPTVICHTLHV